MTEADKVSELHQEVKNSLLNEDLEKVKNWQKDAYHKQIMGGFKETKEAEDGFRKAQKPWAKKIKEVPGGRLPRKGRGWAAGLKRGRLIRGRVSTDVAGGALPTGIGPTGEQHCLPERNTHRWGRPCSARWEGVHRGRQCREMHRWVGAAPEYLELGPASLPPFKNVCSQLPVERAGGRG